MTIVMMLIAPMGLKFEHALSKHSQTSDCKYNKSHYHTDNSHSDFLDHFFQPLFEWVVKDHPSSKNHRPIRLIFSYHKNFVQSNFNHFSVRGPPA